EIAPPAGVSQIGDSPCCMLPDGRFLLGSFNGTATFLWDPATGTWTPAAAKGDSGSEETWVLMADGTVVTPQCTDAPHAEKYLIASDQWQSAGTLTSNLVEAASLEIGPGLLLPDGRAFFIGASGGVTGLYSAASTSQWSGGPAIPPFGGQAQGAKDGPAALLPSGSVLFPVAPVDGTRNNYLSPCSLYEFDGASLIRTSDPPSAACPPYVSRLLLIPTGQVLWAREDDDGVYAYTETGQPQGSYRPVVTLAPTIVAAGGATIVGGTQFNGLSQAVSYGDDYAAATNYPLVRIHNLASGHLRYCRTHDHASNGVTSMGVATGAAFVTTQVELPGDLETGDSELVVVANGIPSAPVQIKVR
ncbi:MAG TPA: hypothetical protein VGR07_17880, partial [Thermoanaerobaculia bacterium]|nr:hypothetical protein [Thermoanaerobaculia bacterium]